MSVPTRNAAEVDALDLPGRRLQWLVGNGSLPAESCSASRLRVTPGDKVLPAHSHPNGKEVVCFFAPPTGLENHVAHEGVDLSD